MSEHLFEEVIYRTITPLHVGCGDDVGVVDLPVVRERTTGYPYLPGSGIRGGLRDRFEAWDREMARRLFGEEPLGEISRGCVRVLDARILLFPVRSAPGIFHWITAPLVLSRFQRDRASLLGVEAGNEVPLPPGSPDETHCWGDAEGDPLFLEEYPLTPEASPWRWTLPIDGVDEKRVVLVHDDLFRFFVQDATMILQRNRLSSVKRVVQGALFSLEAIPPETVFYGFLGAGDERAQGGGMSREEVASALRQGLLAGGGAAGRSPEEGAARLDIQLGGDTAVGMGITRIAWSARGAREEIGGEGAAST